MFFTEVLTFLLQLIEPLNSHNQYISTSHLLAVLFQLAELQQLHQRFSFLYDFQASSCN